MSTFVSTEELRACWELCRLHNNIGFWVVYIPLVWSILMAYHAQPSLSASVALARAAAYVPLCFGIKSLIMTIDDILDSDVDGLVERTKNRPLPRGAISLTRAWIFFVLQVIIGVATAVLVLSPSALRVSMLVWPIYLIYPTCKRWTNLAPIPLVKLYCINDGVVTNAMVDQGIMFNIGVFMGWCDLHVEDAIRWDCLVPVYLGACMWTFTYETVYQHQDKTDDIKIGLNSPALLLGEKTIPVCSITAGSFFGLIAYGGIVNGQGIAFYVGSLVAGFMLFSRLLKTDVDVSDNCRGFFLQTPKVGGVITLGLLIDVVSSRLGRGIAL